MASLLPDGPAAIRYPHFADFSHLRNPSPKTRTPKQRPVFLSAQFNAPRAPTKRPVFLSVPRRRFFPPPHSSPSTPPQAQLPTIHPRPHEEVCPSMRPHFADFSRLRIPLPQFPHPPLPQTRTLKVPPPLTKRPVLLCSMFPRQQAPLRMPPSATPAPPKKPAPLSTRPHPEEVWLPNHQ
jgi:hypothetical protein